LAIKTNEEETMTNEVTQLHPSEDVDDIDTGRKYALIYEPGDPVETLENVDAVLALLQEMNSHPPQDDEGGWSDRARYAQYMLADLAREAVWKTARDLAERDAAN
jgi:hypothetical protein